jgi:hypothetical protein
MLQITVVERIHETVCSVDILQVVAAMMMMMTTMVVIESWKSWPGTIDDVDVVVDSCTTNCHWMLWLYWYCCWWTIPSEHYHHANTKKLWSLSL